MAKKKKARKTKAKSRKPARKRTRQKTVKKKTTWRERDLEEGLRETFPGSDPLAVTDPTRSIKE
jgi:cobalamin-dependent methionine synthase I